jgi:adenylate kinase family enzyme
VNDLCPRTRFGNHLSVGWCLVKRVVIIGCGGSGKTHLARRLAELLNLPLTHLDAVYYDANWKPLPHSDFAKAQETLVARPEWVIEGNYASTMPLRLRAADTVILLDPPTVTCLRRILQRRTHHGAGQHPATGLYPRITWSFIAYILTYRRAMLPRVHQLIIEHADEADVLVLHSRAEVENFLADHDHPAW